MDKPYFKDFNEWTRFKKILENIEIPLMAHEGEIWNASMGVNLGTEIDGKGVDFQRPVVIVRIFGNKQYWIIPVSTQKKALIPQLQVRISHMELHQPSVVVLNQLSLLSNKRLLGKIGRLDILQFKAIIKALLDLFPK